MDLKLPKKGLVRDVKTEGSLGCNDNEMLEFRILKAGNKGNSKQLGTLEEKTMKESAWKNSWDLAPEGRKVQDSWLISKITLAKLKNRPCQ